MIADLETRLREICTEAADYIRASQEPAPPGLPTVIPRDERDRRLVAETRDAVFSSLRARVIEAIAPIVQQAPPVTRPPGTASIAVSVMITDAHSHFVANLHNDLSSQAGGEQ